MTGVIFFLAWKFALHCPLLLASNRPLMLLQLAKPSSSALARSGPIATILWTFRNQFRRSLVSTVESHQSRQKRTAQSRIRFLWPNNRPSDGRPDDRRRVGIQMAGRQASSQRITLLLRCCCCCLVYATLEKPFASLHSLTVVTGAATLTFPYVSRVTGRSRRAPGRENEIGLWGSKWGSKW